MTVEEAIRSRVGSLAAVTALTSTRVYLLKLPHSPTLPAVRVQIIDDPTSYHERGPNGLNRARVQVDAVVSEISGVDPYAQAATLAAAIHGDGKGKVASGLSGWIGVVSNIDVTGCFRVDRDARYESDELRLITIRQDYYVWYRTT